MAATSFLPTMEVRKITGIAASAGSSWISAATVPPSFSGMMVGRHGPVFSASGSGEPAVDPETQAGDCGKRGCLIAAGSGLMGPLFNMQEHVRNPCLPQDAVVYEAMTIHDDGHHDCVSRDNAKHPLLGQPR